MNKDLAPFTLFCFSDGMRIITILSLYSTPHRSPIVPFPQSYQLNNSFLYTLSTNSQQNSQQTFLIWQKSKYYLQFRLGQEFNSEQMNWNLEELMSMLTFRWHMMKISRWNNDRKLYAISIYASKRLHALVHINFDRKALIQFYVL